MTIEEYSESIGFSKTKKSKDEPIGICNKISNNKYQEDSTEEKYCVMCEFACRMEIAVARRKKIQEKTCDCLLPNYTGGGRFLNDTNFLEEEDMLIYEQHKRKINMFSSFTSLKFERKSKENIKDLIKNEESKKAVDRRKLNHDSKIKKGCQLCQVAKKIIKNNVSKTSFAFEILTKRNFRRPKNIIDCIHVFKSNSPKNMPKINKNHTLNNVTEELLRKYVTLETFHEERIKLFSPIELSFQDLIRKDFCLEEEKKRAEISLLSSIAHKRRKISSNGNKRRKLSEGTCKILSSNRSCEQLFEREVAGIQKERSSAISFCKVRSLKRSTDKKNDKDLNSLSKSLTSSCSGKATENKMFSSCSKLILFDANKNQTLILNEGPHRESPRKTEHFGGSINKQITLLPVTNASKKDTSETNLMQNGLLNRVLKLQDDVSRLSRAMKVELPICNLKENEKNKKDLQYFSDFPPSEAPLHIMAKEKPITKQSLVREYLTQLRYLECECKSELYYLSKKKENIDRLAGMVMCWGPMIC